MLLSVFDLFKTGIGPSSSHTMGPMNAARAFLDELRGGSWPRPAGASVSRLQVSLHGSLAFTAKGHGSDKAVILGLSGEVPESVDPDKADGIVEAVMATGRVTPPGHPGYDFDPAHDLVTDFGPALPGHANGMIFKGVSADGRMLISRTFYSVGGGFVLREEDMGRQVTIAAPDAGDGVPFAFRSAADLLDMAETSGLTIAAIMRANEESRRPRHEVDGKLDALADAMERCIERGLSQQGQLPGGLKVRRRAAAVAAKLAEEQKTNRFNPLAVNDWLIVHAMAVNEENAAGGRVVTAPTNGAAGVVPAVMRHWLQFHDGATRTGLRDFLLTAGAIGLLIKSNASISGAEVGCQGEVGSAAAMAAAGLAAALGGTPRQVENAAEIALEHHLGMTCDPVGGLVQVPCIERNGLGAVKAVAAASLALRGDGAHLVPLDACIETMRQTGRDMSERYKETSQGGLAVNVPDC
ncbi:MAG: L-serine ammonia-lyase [Notoacmeibacter sp.]|nr:L-serine ammonia-lyase [Notoacmeibacter sp.]